MNDPKEQSERWMRQAEYDLKEAEASLARKSFSYTCFFAEQAAQKALKGFLISRNERFVPLHSIADLIKKAAKFEKRFKDLLERGKLLDRYYLITRYPDALPSPSVPYEMYSEEEAKESLSIAREIFTVCRKLLGS